MGQTPDSTSVGGEFSAGPLLKPAPSAMKLSQTASIKSNTINLALLVLEAGRVLVHGKSVTIAELMSTHCEEAFEVLSWSGDEGDACTASESLTEIADCLRTLGHEDAADTVLDARDLVRQTDDALIMKDNGAA